MPGEERAASSPLKGGLRDALRTFVAFGVAFVFVKIGAMVPGIDLASAQEAVVVIITSGILAFAGKAFRNKGLAIGKVI